jgi:hypothetical protein
MSLTSYKEPLRFRLFPVLFLLSPSFRYHHHFPLFAFFCVSMSEAQAAAGSRINPVVVNDSPRKSSLFLGLNGKLKEFI